MTHIDTLLITLTVLHWIAAYFTCRWDYRTSKPRDELGLGALWVPILGWFMIWFMLVGGLIIWLDSPGFRAWFYGRRVPKPKPSAALRDVIRSSDPNTLAAITQHVTNGLIINVLVTRSFSTHYTKLEKKLTFL